MSREVRRVNWGDMRPWYERLDDGPDERPVKGTCATCQVDLTTGDPHSDWCPEEKT